MFLEEVALLDPRCKTSYLSDAHGFLVSNRVISSAASLVPSVVDDPSPNSSQQKVTGMKIEKAFNSYMYSVISNVTFL
ncbi:hypothetical protein DPMN_172424 [Dreissena polymorpha]|uniref:Uncharacterized protein n=1 Tax=Dreissena polymorpha TaxID=45954 RepID=A0A9D4E3M0_DREPO|nr:hypothetical protein DPMN_172424 [Dreissena polymorpha]